MGIVVASGMHIWAISITTTAIPFYYITLLHLLVCHPSAYPLLVQWQVDALLYGSKKARLFEPFCMRHANLCACLRWHLSNDSSLSLYAYIHVAVPGCLHHIHFVHEGLSLVDEIAPDTASHCRAFAKRIAKFLEWRPSRSRTKICSCTADKNKDRSGQFHCKR